MNQFPQNGTTQNKHYLPGDIRSKTTNQSSEIKVNSTKKLESQNVKKQKEETKKQHKSSSSTISGKTTSIITNNNIISKNLSAWERATAVLKKPTNSSSIQVKKRKLEPEYEINDDEDEEHDSDMDDFICDDDDDEGDDRVKINGIDKNYSKEIQKIFKYNRDRYRHLDDDDDPNMEASYHDIEREERKRYEISERVGE